MFDHITIDDHINLICSIYKAAGYSFPSKCAVKLISEGFEPLTTSLKLFQKRLLSNNEVFHKLLEKIWWKDSFFRLIAYADVEFLTSLINKVIDKEIVLDRNHLNILSNELDRKGRDVTSELNDMIKKMDAEVYR